MTKVFISYSRRDKEFTRELFNEFQKNDIDCWIDWEGIPVAVDWWDEIKKGIEDADSFLYLISPDSLHSEVCQRELHYAVKKNKRIIPIIVRELDSNDKLPDSLLNLELFQLTRKDSNNAPSTLITTIHQDEDWAWMYKKLEFKASEWDFNKSDKKYLLYNDEYLNVRK